MLELILQPLHGVMQPTLLSSYSPGLGLEEQSSILGVSQALQCLCHGYVLSFGLLIHQFQALVQLLVLCLKAGHSGFQLQLPTYLVASGTGSGGQMLGPVGA